MAKNDESKIQIGLVSVLNYLSNLGGKWSLYFDLVHAIPNGGKRDIRTAGIQKCEGVRKGIPDLFLPVVAGIYHGLYLECKTAAGRLSPDQIIVHDKLRRNGFKVVVFRSVNEGLKILSEYFSDSEIIEKGSEVLKGIQ